MRDLLIQPEVDECSGLEENDSFHLLDDSSESAAILGLQRIEKSLYSYHPPLSQAVTLFETFKANVEPLVHIFHMPTLEPICWKAFSAPDRLDYDTEALLFAIYYSAVISIETQECEVILGVPRTIALKHYRYAVQQAMARADILNTQSILFLQAVVLFLSALRNEDASRTCWSLTALVFNSARAMGLHRDGTGFGLSPLETEIRRRLWWNICLLDIRSSEYHGFEPIAHESMFNTRVPLNINDSDITAEMKDPPVQSEGATEMTFSLIRCEVMRVGWKIGYVNFQAQDRTETSSFSAKISLVRDMQHTLEQKYLRHCTSGGSLFEVCETVVRLTIARTWLVLYCPLSQPRNATEPPTGIKDWLFSTSLRVLELTTKLLTDPLISQWRWHSKTHVQWHAAVFALSEICSRPPSNECDRAWGYVQTLYNTWEEKNNKGNIWVPIKRLMAKAQQTREKQRVNGPNNPILDGRWSETLTQCPDEPGASTIGSLSNISPETQKVADGPNCASKKHHESVPTLEGSPNHTFEPMLIDFAGLDDILCQPGVFDIENMINSYADYSGESDANLAQWQPEFDSPPGTQTNQSSA